MVVLEDGDNVLWYYNGNNFLWEFRIRENLQSYATGNLKGEVG